MQSHNFSLYLIFKLAPIRLETTYSFGFAIFIFLYFFSFSVRSQCTEIPFPDQWSVHQLQSGELPYRSVYIYADFDIDGDGRKDIVTGGWWYRNPGSASGNWVRSTIGGSFKNMAYIYDFDGDGDFDLLGTTGAYTGADLVWAENNGSGNFTIHSNIPSGDTDYSEPFLAGIAGADFQNTGSFQMAINWNGAEATDSPVQMLTVPSDPINTQWTLVDISSNSLGEDLQKGDIDDDGDLDLFQSKNWLRNNGNGTWSTINIGIDYVTTPDRAQLSDFDGDGDLDAVVGQLSIGTSNSARREFAWFEAPSNPEQNWIRHTLATDINGSLSIFAEDIDLDGDDDIIVGEWKGDNRLIAFENDLCDSGTWIRHTINPGGTGFDHHDGARVVDIDDDGDFDIVSIGWDNIIPRIFENTSSTINEDPPVVGVPSDQSISLPISSIELSGSGSDPDGGDVTFQWTQTSGPSTATLTGDATESLTASELAEGSYVFRLTVTDDENDTAVDEVTVTVNPEVVTIDPISNAGESKNIVLPTNSITLTGSGSDPDGGEVSFQWTQASGPNTATLVGDDTAELTASDLVEGSYVFRLTVTDDEDDTAFDEVTVTLSPEPIISQDPVVDASADQELVLPVNSITLSGSGSDPDGGEVSFQWTQTSGPNTATLVGADAAELTASNLVEGNYVFRLTVTDDEDDTAFDEVTVMVNPEIIVNQAPEANASANIMNGEAPLEVAFNALDSRDDLGIVSYSWDFGDGSTSSETNPTYTFETPGTYVVTLLVEDADGLTDSAEITISVTETTAIETAIRLEINPVKNGTAKLLLINQPTDVLVIAMNLHDSQGQLIKEFNVQDISIENDSYEIPVANLSSGIYYIGIEMNNGNREAISLLVKN